MRLIERKINTIFNWKPSRWNKIIDVTIIGVNIQREMGTKGGNKIRFCCVQTTLLLIRPYRFSQNCYFADPVAIERLPPEVKAGAETALAPRARARFDLR
jgi:hypothetical protein